MGSGIKLIFSLGGRTWLCNCKLHLLHPCTLFGFSHLSHNKVLVVNLLNNIENLL